MQYYKLISMNNKNVNASKGARIFAGLLILALAAGFIAWLVPSKKETIVKSETILNSYQSSTVQFKDRFNKNANSTGADIAIESIYKNDGVYEVIFKDGKHMNLDMYGDLNNDNSVRNVIVRAGKNTDYNKTSFNKLAAILLMSADLYLTAEDAKSIADQLNTKETITHNGIVISYSDFAATGKTLKLETAND